MGWGKNANRIPHPLLAFCVSDCYNNIIASSTDHRIGAAFVYPVALRGHKLLSLTSKIISKKFKKRG